MLRTPIPLFAVLAAALVSGPVAAQDTRTLPPPATVVVHAQYVPPTSTDLPMPPRAAFAPRPGGHRAAPLPVAAGPGLPPPDSPPLDIGHVTGASGGPGELMTFLDSVVQPAGALVSEFVVEPSVAIDRDTALYTGNVFAALSPDSGSSWQRLNPYTRFGAPDGGFCCDQRALFVLSPEMTLWVLQYAYSPASGTGRHVIAFARGRDELRSDTFHAFSITPQLFGFPSGLCMDFPDMQAGIRHLYGSSFVCRPDGSIAGSVLWRAQLTDIADLGGVTISYYTNAQLGGWGSYRFARGSTNPMYWAAHRDTANLNIYRWDELNGNATFVTQPVSPWSNSPTPAPGPDGRDWTGFGPTLGVITGYATAAELGFLWPSGAVQGRPQMFVRYVRLAAGGATLLSQHDWWDARIAIHFPAVAVNARGHIGGVFCFGGDIFHPSVAAFVVDDFVTSHGRPDLLTVREGVAGPRFNRWGDYLDCQRHPVGGTTWVATGFTLQSAPPVSCEPRYVWFGRQRDEPAWVDLSVGSTPAGGAPVLLDVRDRFGDGDGTASFRRSFAPLQGYTVTAAASYSIGGETYLFDRWAVRTAPGTGFTLQPQGRLDYTASSIGSDEDTVQARYQLRRRVTVQAAYATSVPIAVSRLDLNGLGNGVTQFVRHYRDGDATTLTAPADAAPRSFHHWILDGVPQPAGETSLSVPMTGHHLATAVYGFYTAGRTTAFGSGCAGSNGTPSQVVVGAPEIGASVDHVLRDGPVRSVAALAVGASRSFWGGVPLPFTWPGTACQAWNDVIAAFPAATTATGRVRVPVAMDDDVGLIGAHYFAQFWCVDPPANVAGLTTSNARDALVGGWDLR